MSTKPVARTVIAPAKRRSEQVGADDLVARAAVLLDEGFRVATIAGHDDGDRLRVIYVFTSGPPDQRVELEVLLDPDSPRVPSLAHLSFPAGRFERELHDLYGIEPIGHPFLRPLVLHQHWPRGWYALKRDAGRPPTMRDDAEPYPFVPVEGPGVYEIPVGPVHAGLIEPGHFRFFVVGETILSMKARLWFVHRGVERLLEGASLDAAVAIAERISGDSAVGHNLAFTLAIEEALGLTLPEDSARLRALLLELERVYNHVADVGALCNDVGFGLAQARALALREQLLRLNEEVTGHRLLRGAIRPGTTTVRRLPQPAEVAEVRERFDDLVDLATSNTVVADRFRGTAVLAREDAVGLGVLGVVARASGLELDARRAHPFVDLGEGFIPELSSSGDVWARFSVRVGEVRASLALVDELATASAKGASSQATRDRTGSGLGIVEGWRGSIVHRVEVATNGTITRCKVVDPSFLNWPALSTALADTIVPDFPLANKSFNLSYAGNDL